MSTTIFIHHQPLLSPRHRNILCRSTSVHKRYSKMKFQRETTMGIHFLVIILTIVPFLPFTQCSKYPPRLITSKQTCLSKGECPPTHFCNTDSDAAPPFTCVPYLRRDDKCNIHIEHQCQPNLYCTDSGTNGGPARCIRGSERGLPCDPSKQASCAGYPFDACALKTKICIEADVGDLKDDCSYGGCNKSKGLYCDINNHRCEKQKSVGVHCSHFVDSCDDSTYCDNPFHLPLSSNRKSSICIKASRLGQKCLSDEHCKGSTHVCNIVSGRYGKCVMSSRLHTKPGMRCNPGLDSCDGRRGLSCQKFNGRYVCMQRATYRANFRNWITPFCTPNNRYSKCTPYFGRPTECRLRSSCKDFPRCEQAIESQMDPRRRTDPNVMLATKYFPSCLGKRKYLKQGSICNIQESEICGSGLYCHFVPHVDDYPDSSPFQRTGHCVKVVKQVNGDCSDPFSTLCATGMACVNGRCKKGGRLLMGKSKNKKTHIGMHSSKRCDKSKLPCAPGLICYKNEGRCDRPRKVMKKGQSCYEISQYRRVSSHFRPSFLSSYVEKSIYDIKSLLLTDF